MRDRDAAPGDNHDEMSYVSNFDAPGDLGWASNLWGSDQRSLFGESFLDVHPQEVIV
jgi:hypothetical protein